MRAATAPLPPGPFDVVYVDPPCPYDFSIGEAGRPPTFVYSRTEARRLRAEGLSWRGIRRELRLPERARSSVRWTCNGVQNPPLHGGAGRKEGRFCTGADA